MWHSAETGKRQRQVGASDLASIFSYSESQRASVRLRIARRAIYFRVFCFEQIRGEVFDSEHLRYFLYRDAQGRHVLCGHLWRA